MSAITSYLLLRLLSPYIRCIGHLRPLLAILGTVIGYSECIQLCSMNSLSWFVACLVNHTLDVCILRRLLLLSLQVVSVDWDRTC